MLLGGGAALRALWPAASLLVWGLHFGAIYAVHAVACERGLAGEAGFLGLPFVPSLVLPLTAAALAALLWLALPGLRALRADPAEGGETEPDFRAWFSAASAVAAGFAVLYQTAPALALPPC